MTQTQKRLSIIELAISMTDIETINLQVLKLQPLRSDIHIDTILSELKAENYAQAKKLIAQYHTSPNHPVVQRIPLEELKIIDSFDFLEVKTSNNVVLDCQKTSSKPIQAETSDYTKESECPIEENISKIDIQTPIQSFDTLINIDSKSVLEENIKLDITREKEKEKEKIDFALDQIPQDTFLNTDNINLSEKSDMSYSVVPEDINDGISKTTTDKEEHTTIESIQTEKKADIDSYVLLRSLENTYLPLATKEVYSLSLQNWLDAINENDYDDKKIENIINHVDILSQTDKAEAAQFLLASSITKAPYAQFILARALYKGIILSRNLEESFRIMSQLTHKDHYPQAVCDLAQFYENGIATKKNKKEALSLYKEAMDSGVDRAKKHYERLKAETSGLFSFFK